MFSKITMLESLLVVLDMEEGQYEKISVDNHFVYGSCFNSVIDLLYK